MTWENAMLDIANDIQSLSHFKRKTAEIMKRMKETGNPIVLTVNGKAEIVVQETAAYQRLRELADKAEMMEFLLESLADMEAGRTEPALEALERLAKKYKLKRKRK
jgi:prevent-host-death family protein